MSGSAKSDKRIRNILLRNGLLAQDTADRAWAAAVEKDKSFVEVLTAEGMIDGAVVLGTLSEETGIPPVDLGKIQPPDDLFEDFSRDIAENYSVSPVSRIGNLLTLAIADPFDVLKLDDIRIVTRCEIRPVLALEPAIRAANDRFFNRRQKEMEDLLAKGENLDIVLQKEGDGDGEFSADLDALRSGDESSPVVKFVNLVILEAIQKKASDIHIEPMEKRVRLRYRIDGILQDVHSTPRQMQSGLSSRVKIMASMDIAERGRPQDGMFSMRLDNRKVDFRVSIIPITFGEKVVIRILDGSSLVLTLDGLGFEPQSLEDFRWAIRQPYGMILATGPSGSGKTTTLYSGLKEILNPDDNVITVEDPVEYQMEGVNQVQVNTKAGLTFAAALRSILRQDPDKIMVGEIRDAETIEIALRAALTGHLVMSTLHTNDAAQAVTRILNMGIDHFLVASTGLMITGQRLARRLCTECKVEAAHDPEELANFQFKAETIETARIFKANPDGCPRCYKGYRGRLAIIESLRSTDDIRKAIIDGGNALAIKKIAVKDGMMTLRRAGIAKVLAGMTSIDEIGRVTMED